MKITEIDQFKMNHTYYYGYIHNKNVIICTCKYKDWSKERTALYGYNTGNADMLGKVKTQVIFFEEDDTDYSDHMYMETAWCYHQNFYTTLKEVYKEMVRKVFI